MEYKELSDLTRDLDLLDLKQTDEKTQSKVAAAIKKVRATDNEITTPWIFQILRKNQQIPSWNDAYKHWVELRNLFGKKSDEAGSVKNQDMKGSIDTNDKQEKLQRHIQGIANALQEIKVSEENIKDVMLLACTIIGVNKRFNDLDQGILTKSHSNWIYQYPKKLSNASITRAIAFKTGKNRSENFLPIYLAVENLINDNPLLQVLKPGAITLNQKDKKPNTKGSFEYDEKIVLHNYTGKNYHEINLEIQKVDKELVELTERYLMIEPEVEYFTTLDGEIQDALSRGRVIDYDAEIAAGCNLNDAEIMAWQEVSRVQDSSYLHQAFNYAHHVLLSEYQSPQEIMQPLLHEIKETLEQGRLQQEKIDLVDEHMMRLKSARTQMRVAMHTTDLALAIKNRAMLPKETKLATKKTVRFTNPLQEEKYPITLDPQRQVINQAKDIEAKAVPATRTKSWWRAFFLPATETGLGGLIGWGIGFGVGTVFGIFFAGGIGAILTAPLCGKVGAAIGIMIGGGIALATYNSGSSHRTLAPENNEKKDDISNNTNIFKRLCICPRRTSNDITITDVVEVKTASVPEPQPSVASVPDPTIRRINR